MLTRRPFLTRAGMINFFTRLTVKVLITCSGCCIRYSCTGKIVAVVANDDLEIGDVYMCVYMYVCARVCECVCV